MYETKSMIFCPNRANIHCIKFHVIYHEGVASPSMEIRISNKFIFLCFFIFLSSYPKLRTFEYPYLTVLGLQFSNHDLIYNK